MSQTLIGRRLQQMTLHRTNTERSAPHSAIGACSFFKCNSSPNWCLDGTSAPPQTKINNTSPWQLMDWIHGVIRWMKFLKLSGNRSKNEPSHPVYAPQGERSCWSGWRNSTQGMARINPLRFDHMRTECIGNRKQYSCRILQFTRANKL